MGISKNVWAENAYKNLLENILRSIENIDDETFWSSVEPQGWLDMMELQRLAMRLRDKK